MAAQPTGGAGAFVCAELMRIFSCAQLIGRTLQCSLLLSCLCYSVACEAKVHAMVVGIDRYQHLPPLAGAVNDARDIAGALQKITGSDVAVLLNDAASYDAIHARWFAMLDSAQVGDTVVFSYAGHGSRVPELVKGSEADGQDDVFVLGAYSPGDSGQRELIRDNQLFEWFRAAQGKGVHLLFVADSCHSGTMTRAADLRVGSLRTRQVQIDFEEGLEDELTVQLSPATTAIGRSDLPYLTFLSAGLESQQIPEVTIKSINGGSDARGALSFVLARAIEGEADRNSDQVLTREELRHYVIENVNVLSERQQTPELSPTGQRQQAVLALTSKSIPVPKIDFGIEHLLYAEHVPQHEKNALARAIEHLQWVPTAAAADLFWDGSTGELLSAAGDLLATGISVDEPAQAELKLRGALNKRTALQILRDAARARLLTTLLQPDASAHALGEKIELSFSGQHGEYMVVFNLAGDGTVQMVYPLTNYGDPLRHGRRAWSMPLQVSDPLGEDHMIALAFKKPQPQLLAALQELDGARAPLRVVSMLTEQLEKRRVEVGIIGMFSQP